jgi:hypothetical protein
MSQLCKSPVSNATICCGIVWASICAKNTLLVCLCCLGFGENNLPLLCNRLGTLHLHNRSRIICPRNDYLLCVEYRPLKLRRNRNVWLRLSWNPL